MAFIPSIPTTAEALGLVTPQQNALNTLMAFGSGAPFPVNGQWYNKQNICLDGYRFIRCHFDNCQLTIEKGTYIIEQCRFTNCNFIFAKEAFNIVQMINMLSTEARNRWPSLVPVYNSSDDTYTFRQA